MNWKRIQLFIGLTLVALVIAAAVHGCVEGTAAGVSGGAAPNWTVQLDRGFVPLALFLVFFRLGRVQQERPWEHAALVWLGAFVLWFLGDFLYGVPLGQILIDIAVYTTGAVAGMGIGLWRQPKPDGVDSEPPA